VEHLVHHALLRDRRRWESVVLNGLTADEAGTLSLVKLPGSGDGKPIALARPFESEPSGIAIGPCNDLALVDTDKDLVIWRDGVCPERAVQLGSVAGSGLSQFHHPCGLLIHADALYVVDRDNSRVLIFRLPSLELIAVWVGPFQQPTGLAADRRGRIYVLDRGLRKILRFQASGVADDHYNQTIANQPSLTDPAFLDIDRNDRLYVSDRHSNQVLQFEVDGTAVGPIPGMAPSFQPRALAIDGTRLYIADADSGQVWVFDTRSNMYLGPVFGFHGPVSAMAVAPDHALWLKTGLDQTFYRLESEQRFVSQGWLTTSEPLDAGKECDWARVHLNADIPAGTAVELRVIARDRATPAPTESDWTQASLQPLDCLVPPLPGVQPSAAGSKRFLWVRAVVTTDEGRVGPRLVQIEAETTSASYLDHLPAVYRREDAKTRFLERWLRLVQGELDDWERVLEDMPRRFDPMTTPEDQLAWLAQWLAFPLPAGRPATELRNLFAKIPSFYERRGTPDGLRDLVQLHTGQRPTIIEAFHARRMWQLGEISKLGVDTALPPALPDGMIVPGWVVANPQLMGLRGDYYEGINFDKLKSSRIDTEVAFDWNGGSPIPGVLSSDNFSVRWTGQVLPWHTDLYTFHTVSDDGVRLWVDGRLIIDNWTDHARTENQGRIALTEGRWYPIVLEYYEKMGLSVIELYWSSRQQRKEVIPQSRLYAVRDEHVGLGGPRTDAVDCPVLVGQTVVGQSQPLADKEYGAPLYNETAHLFTVSVPAATMPTPGKREQLRGVIEQEKPAHADYHLCFVDARMRVGFQARIGIDSIVAGPPAPLSLEGTILGIESFLKDDETQGRIGRVGSHGHIGYDTVLG
jgi:phage tail-like protein